jgi:hypothetical protein
MFSIKNQYKKYHPHHNKQGFWNYYLAVILIFGTIFIFTSCQEYFQYDNLNADMQIPVVKGMVSNDSGPQIVQLYYARPYNSELRSTGITGALVYIKDNFDNKYFYTESSNGNYVCPKGTLKGEIGKTYTLFAELPDGDILYSDPETLLDTLGIEKIYQKYETREEVYRTADNEFKTITTHGQSNYVIIDENYNSKAYYRVQSTFYTHNYSITSSSRYVHLFVYGDSIELEIRTDSIYECASYFSDYSLPKIGIVTPNVGQKESERTQLAYFNTGGYTSETLIDAGLFTYVYTTSKTIYDYYASIAVQLSAVGKTYDPIPTQLVGNMHSLNDSSKTVLGIFEASSHCKRIPNLEIYKGPCDYTVIADTFRIDDFGELNKHF